MKIIAVANQKGGCGKTTTAINLAACLGKKEQRVLLLDLDPQGHCSLGFGVFSEDARDLYDVFTGEIRLEEIILPNVFTGVDVVPATKTARRPRNICRCAVTSATNSWKNIWRRSAIVTITSSLTARLRWGCSASMRWRRPTWY